MAIAFLNNITFSGGAQAEKLRVENLGADPGSGNEGQLYFNTATDKVRVYANGAWTDLDGANDFLTGLSFNTGDGVLTATIPNQSNVTVDLDGRYALSSSIPGTIVESVTAGTYLTNAGTAAAVILNHDNTTRSDTTSASSPAAGGTFQVVDSVTSNPTGHVTAINVKTVTLPADTNTTYDLTTAPTGTAIRLTGSDATNDDVTISGTASEVDITRIGAQELRVGLTDDVTITGELTVSGAGQSSFGGQVTIPQVPTADTDAASKHYVDQAVTGALSYQGGYNPSTNTPDLTTSPNSIEKGWTYTVTADGTFFGEQLRVGDVLIAEVDDPSSLADWTTVQNNIDLADLTTVGIGNVNAGDAIDVSYVSGTATVSVEDSTASNKGAVIVAGGTGIDVTYLNGTATVSHDGTNQSAKRVNLNSGSTGISRSEAGGITTFTIDVTTTNHFGSGADPLDIMVEVLGATVNAGDTVYTDVGRSGNNITIKFTGSVSDGSYQALLNNVA